MPKFKSGDRVAWSTAEAWKYAAGTVMAADYFAPSVPVGVVKKAANEQETWFVVTFPDGERTLTQDELVRVAEEGK